MGTETIAEPKTRKMLLQPARYTNVDFKKFKQLLLGNSALVPGSEHTKRECLELFSRIIDDYKDQIFIPAVQASWKEKDREYPRGHRVVLDGHKNLKCVEFLFYDETKNTRITADGCLRLINLNHLY
jgi:hypothetical protein